MCNKLEYWPRLVVVLVVEKAEDAMASAPEKKTTTTLAPFMIIESICFDLQGERLEKRLGSNL